MTEWIITSSVLILVVIVLRTVLKGKISLRIQYALWALVLVRLLIPGSLFSSSISVMNVLPEQAAVSVVTSPAVSAAPVTTTPPTEETVPVNPVESAPAVTLPPAASAPVIAPAPAPAVPETPTVIPWGNILRGVWIAGMAVMALWLIIGNLRFYLQLTRSREIVKYAPPALYVTEGIETPCLFGLIFPAVYVTPEVAADRGALAHVMAHEETHYHHKDHIWSLLRCVCLVVHWYNPLVWLAAALSRRDSELACDEGAIRRLGEEQRSAYGRTLIGLTCAGVGGLLRTATTMTGSKKSIKERIVLIAKKPKMKLYTLIAVILIAAITAGCTFTGRETEQQRAVSWISSLELKDLEWARWIYTGPEGMEKPLLDREQAEQLHAILQELKKEDLLEDSDIDSGEARLAVPVGEDDALFFDCLSDGTLRIYCENRELQEKHGFSKPWRLRCPELYSFIIRYAGSDQMYDEIFDWEEQVKKIAQRMMEEHAAELTVQRGYEVSVGGVMEYKELPVGEQAQNLAIEGVEVRYFLNYHFPGSEDGTPVYGHIVAYSGFMFFRNREDSVILLGHTDEENLSNVYGTSEMIGRYGDKYTAAAMEMHIAYNEQQNEETGTPEYAPENMVRALQDATMDNSALIRIKDNTETELVRNGATMDVLISAAGNLQVLQSSESFDSSADGIYLWLGDSGDRYIRFSAGEEPYRVMVCYTGDGIHETAVTSSPQLYMFLVAAAEMQNAELHDLDGDGFLEGIIWPFSGNQRNIVIYDVYDGAVQRIDVNETMNCKASEFAGQIANIHPNYSKMVRIVNKAGEVDFCKYHDGMFSCVCPLSDVKFSFEADSAQDAVMKFVREVYNNHVRLDIPEGSAYRVKDYTVKSWSIDEVSVGGNAVVGTFEYAFVPEGDILRFADGNLKEGTGDYAGWWIKSGQFLLERKEDGLWHCGGISTGGVVPELSGYQPADRTPSGGDAAAAAAEIAAGMEHVMCYAVFDLNHDGQDEVVIETGTYEQDRIYHFFAFVNGAPVEIGVEYGTHSHLASDGTGLIIAAGYMSVENAYRITWKDGAFRSEQIVFKRYVGNGSYTDWPMEVTCHYTWSAIYGNPQTYRCKEADPQKAAETLIAAYVADLMKMDNMRTFTITDYRNLEVFVTPTLEMSETDRSVYNYNLKDTEIGENCWVVEFGMEYRWTGMLYDPSAGPGNGEVWMEQVDQGSPTGFLLTREGDEFVLQSRYATRN